ncbi:hypothetical protein EI94DRAFT_1702553 [Lactarius quietus]|nr:hypothetical protein EI94DRAFT_1702553 [Lactarius quietus]
MGNANRRLLAAFGAVALAYCGLEGLRRPLARFAGGVGAGQTVLGVRIIALSLPANQAHVSGGRGHVLLSPTHLHARPMGSVRLLLRKKGGKLKQRKATYWVLAVLAKSSPFPFPIAKKIAGNDTPLSCGVGSHGAHQSATIFQSKPMIGSFFLEASETQRTAGAVGTHGGLENQSSFLINFAWLIRFPVDDSVWEQTCYIFPKYRHDWARVTH